MLNIPCPWCGLRNEIEFVCGGEADIMRPADPCAVDDDDWAQYLFFRQNVKGAASERWLHRFGCGQWFTLSRNTRTHEIIGSGRAVAPGEEGNR